MPTPGERDWTLFADWCASARGEARAGGRQTCYAVSSSRCLLHRRVARRRLRAIDAAHVALGLAAPSRRITSPACRFDQGVVAATLGCIPIGGWPTGIVGRRDAALVALVCTGGLTRRQVRALPATPGQGAGPVPRCRAGGLPGVCRVEVAAGSRPGGGRRLEGGPSRAG